MTRHLRYDIRAAADAGMHAHPQRVMFGLCITYQHATPQSMGDQWWFWNCENVPEPLPHYLTPLGIDPREAVGYGLSEDDAERITKGAQS